MFTGIKLGRIGGVQITLDWSMILIFLFVTLSLGSGVFPFWHPDWSPAVIWGVSLAASALLFVSLMLHVLAHSLVARKFGVPVRRTTVYLFGGMTNGEAEPRSPSSEILIATAGPVLSLLLGLLLLFLGSLTMPPPEAFADPLEMMSAIDPLQTMLLWLGPINIFIGLFNLVPSFPLDGGRVLRALIWGTTGNLRKATRWAAGIGQAVAWALILVGLAMAFGIWVPVVGGGPIQGLWLIFIGWFLNVAASTSYRIVAIREALRGVTVGQVMRRQQPPLLSRAASITALVDNYLGTGESLFVVGDSPSEVLGVVRAQDAKQVSRAEWANTPLGQLVTPIKALPSVTPETEAFSALQELARLDFDAMVVESRGELLGILRRDDVARWIELQSQEDVGGVPRAQRPVAGTR